MTGVTVSLGFRKHGLITHACTIRLVWCGVGWSEPSCNFGHVAFQLTSFASFVISLPSLLENLFQRAKSDCPSEKLATVTFSQFMFPDTVCSCQTKAQQNDTERNMHMVDCDSTLMYMQYSSLLRLVQSPDSLCFCTPWLLLTALIGWDRVWALVWWPSATIQWHPFLFLVPAMQSKRISFPMFLLDSIWFNKGLVEFLNATQCMQQSTFHFPSQHLLHQFFTDPSWLGSSHCV